MESINQTNKLHALSLISDCYRYEMELTGSSAIVTDAIKIVNGKMDHLNEQEKKLLQDIQNQNQKQEKEEAGETTAMRD